VIEDGSIRLKDKIGNTLGLIRLSEDGIVHITTTKPITIQEDLLAACWQAIEH
jgi:hypothetical protein